MCLSLKLIVGCDPVHTWATIQCDLSILYWNRDTFFGSRIDFAFGQILDYFGPTKELQTLNMIKNNRNIVNVTDFNQV